MPTNTKQTTMVNYPGDASTTKFMALGTSGLFASKDEENRKATMGTAFGPNSEGAKGVGIQLGKTAALGRPNTATNPAPTAPSSPTGTDSGFEQFHGWRVRQSGSTLHTAGQKKPGAQYRQGPLAGMDDGQAYNDSLKRWNSMSSQARADWMAANTPARNNTPNASSTGTAYNGGTALQPPATRTSGAGSGSSGMEAGGSSSRMGQGWQGLDGFFANNPNSANRSIWDPSHPSYQPSVLDAATANNIRDAAAGNYDFTSGIRRVGNVSLIPSADGRNQIGGGSIVTDPLTGSKTLRDSIYGSGSSTMKPASPSGDTAALQPPPPVRAPTPSASSPVASASGSGSGSGSSSAPAPEEEE